MPNELGNIYLVQQHCRTVCFLRQTRSAKPRKRTDSSCQAPVPVVAMFPIYRHAASFSTRNKHHVCPCLHAGEDASPEIVATKILDRKSFGLSPFLADERL
jgi:hypothetical protein